MHIFHCVCKCNARSFSHSTELILRTMGMFPLQKLLIELSMFGAVLFICRESSCSHFPLGIAGTKTYGRASPCLLGLFFWSTLYSKHPLSGQLGLCSELSCGHSGLSAATSSPLLWCFWHICFCTHSSAKMIS